MPGLAGAGNGGLALRVSVPNVFVFGYRMLVCRGVLVHGTPESFGAPAPAYAVPDTPPRTGTSYRSRLDARAASGPPTLLEPPHVAPSGMIEPEPLVEQRRVGAMERGGD